jgi:hypothetical protein
MAGYRRIARRPRQLGLRVARRRSRLPDRLAAAHTPSARLVAAVQYLRSAMRTAPPAAADRAAAHAVSVLVDLAEQLFETHTHHGRTSRR